MKAPMLLPVATVVWSQCFVAVTQQRQDTAYQHKPQRHGGHQITTTRSATTLALHRTALCTIHSRKNAHAL